MAKWEVRGTMTETYELRVIVDAETREEAEAKAAEALESDEGERIDCQTAVDTVEPLAADHAVRPYSEGARPTACADCGHRVRWTGTPGTATTPTVPGPWVHLEADDENGGAA